MCKAFSQSVESAVVHYGDTTLTFLNNMYKADARGTALTYASAVAVEEKSVIDYNTGNPDGILDPGEVPRPPRIPLVSIYPKEGTLFSDNPLFILDAPWVTDEQKQGAALFQRLRDAAREPSEGARSSASVPATPRSPSAIRSRPRTVSTRTSRRRCSRCPTRRSRSASSTSGTSSGRRPGCCW